MSRNVLAILMSCNFCSLSSTNLSNSTITGYDALGDHELALGPPTADCRLQLVGIYLKRLGSRLRHCLEVKFEDVMSELIVGEERS